MSTPGVRTRIRPWVSMPGPATATAAFGLLTVALTLPLTLLAPPAQAQARPTEPGAIFSCTTAAGKRITSDRPIAECLDRDQHVLNKDGSLRMVMPPSLTSDERAALEESERRKQQEQVARLDAVRRDRNLLVRFPNEEAHQRARETALEPVRAAIKSSEARLAELALERKPLAGEAEFYVGKPLPPKLKARIDSVEVSIEAQRSLVVTQQVELERINANFDAELGRLKKLWGGADPGSLGALPQVVAPKAPAPPPVKRP